MKTRQEVINYARTLIGTPYHHQGRLPGVGLDCIGLMVMLAKFIGLPPNDETGYGRIPDGQSIHRGLTRDMVTIRPVEVQPGDVLTFWIRRPGLVQHVGLATDVGLIHTWTDVHKVAEHSMDARWQKHLAGCFKLPVLDQTPYPTKFKWALDPTIDPQIIREVKRIQPVPDCCD